jgi:hypothetical protein
MRRYTAAIGLIVIVAGCGLNVQSADLFVLTRTGPGNALTLLVTDSGTIRCDGGPAHTLPDPLLLQARQLAGDLDQDVKVKLRIAPVAGSVYSYAVKLQDGTLSFPDKAAATHSELARAELFTAQAAQTACG